jgi:3-methyladenine DNA glycosylase AlkD
MPKMEIFLSALRQELKQQVDEKTAAGYHRYFKEPVTCYGVQTALVSKLGNRYFQAVKKLGKRQIFALCEDLFKSDYNEEAFIACAWAEKMHSEYTESDFPVFERWLQKYINNWAKCDTLCNHTIGSFIDRFPAYVANLKEWARSDNRWLRRAAAVTLIIPARRGRFLPDIFQIADILIADTDDLVQKGYGWLLKEASRRHEKEVFDYVIKHKAIMPRTALRYAIEIMPAELKQRAMAKA